MDTKVAFDPTGDLLATAGPAVLEALARHDGDPAALRPYRNPDGGQPYIVRNVKNKWGREEPTIINVNAQYPLYRDQWVEYRRMLIEAAQPRQSFTNAILGAGMREMVPGGIGKTMLVTTRVGDISPAIITMDPTVRGQSDRQVNDEVRTPLPLIHKDLDLNWRQLEISKQDGRGALDTTLLKAYARRVAEAGEMLNLGTWPDTITYSGGTVYGALGFPNRITATLTSPSTSNQATTINEVNAFLTTMATQYHRGPFRVFASLPWKTYLNGDYNLYLGKTLGQRLLELDGISSIEVCEYMRTGYTFLFVEMDAMTFTLAEIMDLQLIQWETMGGMLHHYKVIMGRTPVPMCDQYGNCGIGHMAVP